jgi:sterol desaturase/sphingolipid hydroxylase (fatty acid hydroxylase superfamily)
MPDITDFQSLFLENEATLRLFFFVVLLVLLLIFEHLRPRRLPDKDNRFRRINNIMLLLVNIIMVRLLLPLALFQLALFAEHNSIGLFNFLAIPPVFNIVFTIVIFDLLIYIQHVLTHKVKFLWRIHRVHHTDLEVDVTTGIRFHPLEIIFSLLYKMLAVLLIGPLAIAIILYEILLNAAALFTHSNILLNSKLDHSLRTVLVTPDMHRIHHSVVRKETDSNFGNILSVWDKLFKTYHELPEAGYDKMVLGLDEYRQTSSGNLVQLLKIPFMKAGKV